MIRESVTSFEPRPFRARPKTIVRWRGTGVTAAVPGCTDPAALNYDPLATVDDGSCVYPPSCPELTLVCDSISASKSKCGYSHGGSYWRQKECYAIGSGSHSSAGPPASSCSGSIAVISTGVFNSDCSSFNVYCSGSGSITRTLGDDTVSESGSWGGPYSNQCAYSIGTQDYIYFLRCTTFTGPGGSSCPSGVLENYTEDCSESRSGGGGSASWSVTVTYSDEYTTSDLIDNTIATLPAYSGFDGDHSISGQGTTCSATRDLSSDETSYSIRRFKYKFTFETAAVSFTIQWKEHFVPSGGGAATDTDKSETQDIGDTESNEFTVNEPSTNGTTTIIDITCTIP